MAGASSLTLPPTLTPSMMIGNEFPFGVSTHGNAMSFGAMGDGSTNLGNIWTLSEQHQTPRTINSNSVFADLSTGYWSSFRSGRWFAVAGSGTRQRYEGNRDAGQLWLDLHSDVEILGQRSPQLTMCESNLTWYGLGYQLPYRCQQVQGIGWFMARYLDPSQLRMGGVLGNVNDGNYSGMVRLISSKASPNASGSGWALDAGISSQIGNNIRCSLIAEGLAGAISWRNIDITDLYVSSPDVFEDPDGFLHETWSGEGMEWKDDITLHINPTITATLGYGRQPMVLAGFRKQDDDTIPQVGLAMPYPQHCTTYLTCQPSESAYEFGCTGKYGSISLLLDDTPEQAGNITLQANLTALTF